MEAHIISIGEELLLGKTVNTNAAWIASQLDQRGIATRAITSVADSHEEILRCVDQAASGAGLILITGGLGPTRDDVTRHALCEYFGSSLHIDHQVLEDIRLFLKKRGRQLRELNHRQALVPRDAKVIRNPHGTAPGLWFTNRGKHFIAMPGVPHEMSWMMQHRVLPDLKSLVPQQSILHKTLLTHGIGESDLSEKLSIWESGLPPGIRLAYLPDLGIVRLRLTARGKERDQLLREMDEQIRKLGKCIPGQIYAVDHQTLEGVAGELLGGHGHRLAVAESCTGGYLAHRITGIAGSSAYFIGGVVAYDNRVKQDLLNVCADRLRSSGAVSGEVAEDMALGVAKRLGATHAIGITGIAGPGGGNREKPVGTTWIAVSGKAGVTCRKFLFADNRQRNIVRAANSALAMLIDCLKEEAQKGCFSTTGSA